MSGIGCVRWVTRLETETTICLQTHFLLPSANNVECKPHKVSHEQVDNFTAHRSNLPFQQAGILHSALVAGVARSWRHIPVAVGAVKIEAGEPDLMRRRRAVQEISVTFAQQRRAETLHYFTLIMHDVAFFTVIAG